MTQLRKAREAQDISTGLLASRTGIDQRQLQNMDAGRAKISIDNAVKISKALGVKIKATTTGHKRGER